MGVFIFVKNTKSLINITFALLCCVTVWWQLSWVILFSIQSITVADILVKIGYVGIIFIPILFFHFFISFLEDNVKKVDIYILWVAYILGALFEYFLLTSNYFIDGYYVYFWGFYPAAGALHPVYLLLLLALALRTAYLLTVIIKSKGVFSEQKRYQARFMLWGMVFYALASLDFVVNYGFEIYPIGFVFIIIFLGLISYSIAKYRLMNVKVIATESFSIILVIVALIEVFVSKSQFEFVTKIIIFSITLIFAILLIRSVLREVQRREEMEKLAQQLSKVTKKLQKANVQLKRLDEAKSEFISIASHQLRTPLTAIKGYGSMLLDGDFGNIEGAKQRDAIQKMFISGNRLITLVENLLNISRIESGRIKFSFEPKQLVDLVREVYENLKQNAADKKLYLRFIEPSQPLPLVIMDDEKIRQVVINFIDNAIKYTKEGGVTISASQKDGMVECCVQDTGMGVTPEEQAQLFKKFSRGKDANLVNTEGTGLGLYVANIMVEAHKGKIWIESEGIEGKGSKFFFALPLADSAAAKALVAENKRLEEERAKKTPNN
ncbi:MAG: ATP-binding protein [Patescibacteria group bacterium]